MRIGGDGIDFTQGVQAASKLHFDNVASKKVAENDSASVADPRASLGADSASVGGVSLDLVSKGAESAGKIARDEAVNAIKDQVTAGTYNIASGAAILEAAPSLIEAVG
ncbi:MAG: hypothetical protein MK033_06700 [Candidatus Caenarcaniphilales bacterium]|nr:hypothetical protein [Candidatus Caenarcaniphilales bacterium]